MRKFKKVVTSNEMDRYNQRGVVCPPTIYGHIFTTAAIDNIHQNAISSNATKHFHGAPISVFQHPEDKIVDFDNHFNTD